MNETEAPCGVYPPPAYEIGEICVFVIVNILSSLVAIFGNGLVIYIVKVFPYLRTRTTIFLLSLSITDFLVGILVQPLSIFIVLMPNQMRSQCWLTFMLGYTTMCMCGTNGCFLALISYDRYQYISKLNNYYINMTVLKVTILSLICWLFSPVFGSFIFFEKTQDAFFLFVFIALVGTMITICIFYFKSYRTVKTRSVRLNTAHGAVNQKKTNQLTEHWRMAKSLSSVILCYILCWTPMTLFVIAAGSDHYMKSFNFGTSTIAPKLLFGSILCGYLGSAIKPVLYYWKTEELRNGMRTVTEQLYCTCCCFKESSIKLSLKSRFTDTLGKDNKDFRLPSDELTAISDTSTLDS